MVLDYLKEHQIDIMMYLSIMCFNVAIFVLLMKSIPRRRRIALLGLEISATVIMLNKMVTLFDKRAKKEGIEKIKTIGDAYMAAVGLTEEADNDGAERMVRFALGLLEDMVEFNRISDVKLQIRIGINSGELVAGVIGKTKFIYDVWGDNVNIASRMESTGKPGRIHVSEATYEQVKELFDFKERVETEVKGKGLMAGYYL